MNNFEYGVEAMSKEIAIFFGSLVHNQTITGFLTGMIITLIIVGFILTKNPFHIPKILKYSQRESFERIAKRDSTGTYLMSYTEFVRLHTVIRIFFLLASTSFFVMIVVILLTQ